MKFSRVIEGEKPSSSDTEDGSESSQPVHADGLTVTVAERSVVFSETSVSRFAEHADGLLRSGLDSHSSGQVITGKSTLGGNTGFYARTHSDAYGKDSRGTTR